MLIHITGASGSGTSTLAAALAQEHAFVHVEADDHYWLPTDPPFSSKRDHSERASMLVSTLRAQPNTVLAGSVVGWGAEIEDAFDLIVFLYLDADVRVERLRRRENERFSPAWSSPTCRGRGVRSLSTSRSDSATPGGSMGSR